MKIQTVTINKYKAFTNLKTIHIGQNNVFIYGENGSGKSSFYYALKDFFQSSVEEIKMSELRNFNLTDGGNDCSIEVEFTDGVKNIINESIKNTNIPQIADANGLKSFLTYKHLLEVHNVKIKERINVFNLIVNGVLKHYRSATVTNNIELEKIWQELEVESGKDYGAGTDFYFARQKKAFVEEKAKKLNNVLDTLFHSTGVDYMAPFVNRVLSKLVPELRIEFTRRKCTINNWGYIDIFPEINLQIIYNGKLLDSHNPHFALNEAKLSAVAISIFLGAIIKQGSFSHDIKPLFLDDILIGLDNENRMKLLELLLERDIPEDDKVFKDFQIFITTYDKHWYEVARLNLKGWKFLEFYKSDEGPQIVEDDKSHFEKAEAYFKAFKFPECANFLRKECEKVLFELLPETHTYGRFVKDRLKPPSLENLINNLGSYYKDLGIDPPMDLIRALNNYKSIILNPLSHSDLTSPIYRNDLQLAFETIAELRGIELPQRTIHIHKGELFEIKLPQISYDAIITVAENVFKVENEGGQTISPIKFYFSEWTREGVQFAKPKDSPPIAIPAGELLTKVLEQAMPLDKIVVGLNHTLVDRGQAEITLEDLKKATSNPSVTLETILTV